MSDTDFWRDTWARYLGYANEVGESFRPIVPRNVVRASYAVSFAYTLADTADKGYKMYEKDSRTKSVTIATVDALIWQTLASVIIPGFVINRICFLSTQTLTKFTKVSFLARSWITVGIGLMSIPFIVHPIDNGTTALMDTTYRKWFQVESIILKDIESSKKERLKE